MPSRHHPKRPDLTDPTAIPGPTRSTRTPRSGDTCCPAPGHTHSRSTAGFQDQLRLHGGFRLRQPVVRVILAPGREGHLAVVLTHDDPPSVHDGRSTRTPLVIQ